MSVLRTKCLLVARAVPLAVAILLFCTVANAYTIVMRGGRHVDIPDRFFLTDSTLTYEVSPGIQVTINISAIDIAATEKANNEAAGSFLKHRQMAESFEPPPARSAVRTITNRDLQSASVRRRQSEIDYEKRRKELGLPALKPEAPTTSAVDLDQHLAAEQEQENYWRGRAEALRTEMAAVDAQIAYVRQQLEQPPLGITTGSYATVVNILPFSFGGFGGSDGHFDRGARSGIFVGPRTQARAGIVFGPSRSPFGFPHRNAFPARAVGQFPLLLAPNVFGTTYPEVGSLDVQGDLITQFNQLAAARAGLLARWRELEDEARRAGAQPGWLRP